MRGPRFVVPAPAIAAAWALALAGPAHAAEPGAKESPRAAEPAATRIELTDAVTVLYAGDNRDFRPSSVPTVVNDDWGVFYNRLHAELDHGNFRFGFRVDNAWFYASPDPTTVALELVDRRPGGAATVPDPVYFRSKVNEAGRELSNRYINWIYPAKYFAGWSTPDFEVTLGDVYAELGHGLVLSMRKRDELASDDTIRGGRATGRLKTGDVTLGLTLLGGSANPLRIDEASGRYLGVHSSVTPGFVAVTEAGMPRAIETDFAPDTGDCATMLTCSYAPDRIAGGQFSFDIGRTRLGTQGSLLVRQDALSPDLVRSARRIVTASQSFETASPGGALTVYVEAAGQKLSEIEPLTLAPSARQEIDAGHALYASATVAEAPWVFLLEAKHYRRFFPLYANVSTARAREYSLTAWSAPPTGEAPYVDTEFEGFNTCVSGARLRTDAELARGTTVFGWVGYWQTFAERGVNERCETGDENQNDVLDLASGLELTSRDLGSRGTVSVGSRFDDTKTELVTPEGSTHTFYRELHLRYNVVKSLGGPFALELDGVHRRRHRALGGPGEPWFEGENVTAVDIGPKWSLGLGVEYDTDPRVPPTYFNAVGRFRPTSSTSVSFFAGQRRGTLRCEGGVCREVPPFEGVRVDGTVRF
ncbi:MAG TPA: hypothetical protein VF103_18885 [Polyangiaceae bacterium]